MCKIELTLEKMELFNCNIYKAFSGGIFEVTLSLHQRQLCLFMVQKLLRTSISVLPGGHNKINMKKFTSGSVFIHF